MICINPATRKTITIDGVTFTLRPLTWGDRLDISLIDSPGARAMETVKRGIVETSMPINIEGLDPAAALEILQAVNALSNVSETDRKNSSSPSGQSPAAGFEPSTSTASASPDIGRISLIPCPSASVLLP